MVMASVHQSKRRIELTHVNSQPAPVCSPSNQNILTFIREMEGQCISRKSHRNSRKPSKFLMNLVTHRSYSYEKIAELSSRRPIHYDQNNIHMQDFSSKLSIGCSTMLRRSFQQAPFRHNIEDYLFVQGPHPTVCDRCATNHCCKPSLLALSTKNSLSKLLVLHYSVETGYIRYFVLNVSTCYKSAKLDWNVAYESACVSVYIKSQKEYKLFYLSVFPIAYKGCITVHQDIKGSGVIKKAVLSLNMLIFHEGKDTVTLYDISSTLDNLSLEQGDTICINNTKELPPPVLTVKGCDGFDLQIGGFPYRLLIASTGGRYVIKSLDTGQKIGLIEPIESTSIEKDTVIFDETESGHIIQKGEHSIRVFQIPCAEENLNQLQPVYPPTSLRFTSSVPSHPTTSRSGRTLTQRYNQDSHHVIPTILCELDLEDELDLLYTLSCDHSSNPSQLYVNILDCNTLAVLKTEKIDFKMPQKNHADDNEVLFPISVSADRDLLIVNWKIFSRHHTNIYQLTNMHREGNSVKCVKYHM